MTVNRYNFETYMLDYLEGNLDPLLTADLMAFLAENPEFEKYLSDYHSKVSLSGSCIFTVKNLLKKEFSDLPRITPGNFDEFCIAASEHLLNETDTNRLSEYIARHPAKQKDLDLYRHLRILPDTAIQYSHKEDLKKGRRLVPMRIAFYILGAAASIALLIMLVLRKPPEKVYTETPPAPSLQQESPSGGTAEHPPDVSIPAPVVQSEFHRPEEVKSAEIPSEPIRPDVPNLIIQNSIAILADPAVNTDQLAPVHRESLERHDQLLAARRASASSSESMLGSLLSRINFWKTAEKAISGFNYLTESQLSVNKTTDESGKMTSLLIEGESFSIKGKIR